MLAAEFILLAALWGASFLFMRLGAADFGPIPTAGLRVGLAALFLLPALLNSNVRTDLRRHGGPILFVGIFNSGIPFALFAFAVMHVSTGLTSILNATVPLSGAAVAWLWLGDRPGGSRLTGLAIGFAGVLMLVAGTSGLGTGSAEQATGAASWNGLLAMLAALVATLCYGFAASFTKRHLQGVHPLATATGSQIGATLALALPAWWWWPRTAPGQDAWAAIGAVALLCTAIAYILFFRIIDRAGPAKALTVTFLVPVFALGYGALVLGEHITGWMVFCALVIMGGTALSTGLVSWRDRGHA